MADEPMKSERTVRADDDRREVRDSIAPVEYVDLITEVFHTSSVVYRPFETGSWQRQQAGRVDYHSRAVASRRPQTFHTIRGNIIADALKSKAKP
jgi:hypothetical protein